MNRTKIYRHFLVTPYAQLSVGGVLAIVEGTTGAGFFYNPEIGVKVPILNSKRK